MEGYSSFIAHCAMKEAGVETRPPHTRGYAVRVDAFDPPDTEEAAYWMGFMAADGHVNPVRGDVVLALAKKDRAHVERFRDYLCPEAPVRLRGRTGYGGAGSCVAHISSVELARSLEPFGFVGDKTFSIEPWNGPRELLRHYWRGVVDGDGSVFRKRRGKPGYGVSLVGNRAMVEGFADYVDQEVGYRPPVHPHKSIWSAVAGGAHSAKAVAALLYSGATIALERKMRRAVEAMSAPTTYRFKYPEVLERFPPPRAHQLSLL